MGPDHPIYREDSPDDPFAGLTRLAADCGLVADRLFIEQHDPDLLPYVSRLVTAAIHKEFVAPERVFQLHPEVTRLDADGIAGGINQRLILKRMGEILDGPGRVASTDLAQVTSGTSLMSIQALGYVCMAVKLSLRETIEIAQTTLMIEGPATRDSNLNPVKSTFADLEKIAAPKGIDPELIRTPLEREVSRQIAQAVKEALFSRYIAPDQIKALHVDIDNSVAEQTAQTQSVSLLLKQIRRVEGGERISCSDIDQVIGASSSIRKQTLDYICYVLDIDLASIVILPSE